MLSKVRLLMGLGLAIALVGCSNSSGGESDGTSNNNNSNNNGADADIIASCGDKFADCDNDKSNGCEASLKFDPDHCGKCGNKCATGGICRNGECTVQVLASGQSAPLGIAVEGDFVYWANHGLKASTDPESYKSNLGRVKKDGTGKQVIGPADQKWLQDVAIDGDNIIYTQDSSIKRIKKDGTEAQGTAIATGQCNPLSLVVTSATIWWTNHCEVASGGSFNKVAKNAGAPCNDTACRVVNNLKLPWGATADNAYVYYVVINNGGLTGKIGRVDLTGANPSDILPTVYDPRKLVSDGTNIFWTQEASNEIQTATIAGANAKVVVNGLTQPHAVALSGDEIIVANAGSTSQLQSSIVAVKKDGSATRTLATNTTAWFGITVDDKYVYWTDRGKISQTVNDTNFEPRSADGRVMRALLH